MAAWVYIYLRLALHPRNGPVHVLRLCLLFPDRYFKRLHILDIRPVEPAMAVTLRELLVEASTGDKARRIALGQFRRARRFWDRSGASPARILPILRIHSVAHHLRTFLLLLAVVLVSVDFCQYSNVHVLFLFQCFFG